MEDNLRYETWLNAWSGAWYGHRSGTPACRLEELPLESPTDRASPTLVPRLVVENAKFLASSLVQDPFAQPCKKGVCQRKVAPPRFRQFWANLIVRAFAEPFEVCYVIQSREDWIAALDLLPLALPLADASYDAAALAASCVRVLEHTLYRPIAFNAAALFASLNPDGVEDAVLARLAALAVSLTTETVITKWFTDSLHPRLAAVSAQALFDSWRNAGVSGSAAAEKLISFLAATPISHTVYLNILRGVVLSGSASCLANNQSVGKVLRHIASHGNTYCDRYNAALLITELFPRQCWEVIAEILPELASAAHFTPFIYTAFALHDVEKLLELLLQDGDLISRSESCMAVAESQAAQSTEIEIQKLVGCAEAVLRTGEPVSLSWLSFVLAIVAGSKHVLSGEALELVTNALELHGGAVTEDLVSRWCGIAARCFNANVRNCEVKLTILKQGQPIEYRPQKKDPLAKRCLKGCKAWKRVAPGPVKALKARLKLKKCKKVFAQVTMSAPPLYDASAAANAAGEQLIVKSLEQLDALHAKLERLLAEGPLNPWEDRSIDVGDSLRNLYHGWHSLVTSTPEENRVEFFEAHVQKVVATSLRCLNALAIGLSNCGVHCSFADNCEEIFSSETNTTALLRYLELCLNLIVIQVCRPICPAPSLLTELWFDIHFASHVRLIHYFIKATCWFYIEPKAPLSFKIALAQIYALLLSGAPQDFERIRMPLEPIADILKYIKSEHRKLTDQLLSYSMLPSGAVRSDEFDYQREMAQYIMTAMGE